MIPLTKKFYRKLETGTFTLIEGENDPTTFLPLSMNIGGQVRPNKYESIENKYLMEEQARHVYKKVESGNMININTLKQEIEQDQELSKLDNTRGEINPCRELIVNNAEKIETVLSQIE